MALSSILKVKCPYCSKIAVEKSRSEFLGSKQINLECGHVVKQEVLSAAQTEIISTDGQKLRPYQMQAVAFAEEANGRVLIADEQGLGKTVETAAIIALHKKEMMPALVVTKTTLKIQWFHEMLRFAGVPSLIIYSSKDKPFPGFGIYIITYDLLKTVDFKAVGIKTLILDECQAIKNHLSERAKAVQDVAKSVEHVIGLSGTPIKNNAGEYFTILNLLQPRRFPTYRGYLDTYCDSYFNGYGDKIGGLRNPELFHSITKDFIIRRTKAEVLPDLPKLSRNFYHVELDAKLNKVYANGLKELEELYYGDQDEDTPANMLAVMAKLRKITGISKASECTEFVTEHLLNTDRKIVVFAHHVDVVTLLMANLEQWCKDGGFEPPLNLHSGLTAEKRAELIIKFKDSNSRILVASTLAAGEGLNLQFCSDAVMLERQWNPANEEQAEARFHRFGQTNPVSITYMLASETIDEYFTELVEQKRAIVASTLDNKEIAWDQSSLMMELANVLVTKGKKKWTL